ncbi:putative phosphoglycerate mutase family protein [Actinokineospora spheciospongiae]|uniref:Putative phosphoglycerate mutase family protein n=1 Tax=Actinokineospora spheciospongiae TaxID=909613 RepID=W7IMB9_9PSEU|nr:acid phosphatase [Actinokineospora spheciospongiae]EWC62045.1 putative phosphoglycerate mutase family protein [Actinokineospora spheciospongiae]PWW64623.1 putative phosphoglycerate mutase [Actinokineospora spheciospongiae]
MSNTVYLLRHGQTEWSETGKHTGRTDIPLTGEGEARARRAGTVLAGLRGERPAVVITSPRQRAVRTAALAGLVVDETTEELAEWDYGDYEGLTTPEIRETVPGWTVWTHPCPNGETAEQVTDRAVRLVDRVRRLDSDVVLVGHGHFSRVLVATWIGQPSTYGVHFGLDAAGIVVLGDERGVPQIKRMNIPSE